MTPQISHMEEDHACQWNRRSVAMHESTRVCFCVCVWGGGHLLSSCPLPNTSGSGRKDNVSSGTGSWGSSVDLHKCNACYSALSVWRSPAERESYKKTALDNIIHASLLWLVLLGVRGQTIQNPVSYLAAFTSEQSIVVSWHFVPTDGTALLCLCSAVWLCL